MGLLPIPLRSSLACRSASFVACLALASGFNWWMALFRPCAFSPSATLQPATSARHIGAETIEIHSEIVASVEGGGPSRPTTQDELNLLARSDAA